MIRLLSSNLPDDLFLPQMFSKVAGSSAARMLALDHESALMKQFVKGESQAKGMLLLYVVVSRMRLREVP